MKRSCVRRDIVFVSNSEIIPVCNNLRKEVLSKVTFPCMYIFIIKNCKL